MPPICSRALLGLVAVCVLCFVFGYNVGGSLSSSSPAAPVARIDNPIALFYHVGALNGWRGIVHEQLQALRKSGLLERAEYVGVTLLHRNESDRSHEEPRAFLAAFHNDFLGHLPASMQAKFDVSLHHNLEVYEYPTLARVYHYCRARKFSSVDTYVLYLHSKGSRSEVGTKQYDWARDWRLAMEHFVIGWWRDCVEALSRQHCSLSETE
jgi:hypothetical protein